MSYSAERRQAVSTECYNGVGRDPKESLPKPSPWIKNVFQDDELKTALLTRAYDVIEASWASSMPDDETIRSELRERRVAYQNEHALPSPINSMNSAYQKFYYWKFNETLSTAASQSPDFQKMIEGFQSGTIAREEFLTCDTSTVEDSETVLFDFAAADY